MHTRKDLRRTRSPLASRVDLRRSDGHRHASAHPRRRHHHQEPTYGRRPYLHTDPCVVQQPKEGRALAGRCRTETLDPAAATPPDAQSKRHVTGGHSDAFGMQSTEHAVLKQRHKEGLRCFLQGLYGRQLKAQTNANAVGNFADHTGERLLWDETINALLEALDVSQSKCAGTEPARQTNAEALSVLRDRKIL